MTVLLVLFTLIIFLTADYFVQRAKNVRLALAVSRPANRGLIPTLSLPGGISLASNHMWLRDEADGSVTVGLDEFLGRLVGDIQDVLLPRADSVVSPATTEITLRQSGKTLAMASPVLGRIAKVNSRILKNPSLVRMDPYGEGWLIKVRPRPEQKSLSKTFLVARPMEWLKQQAEQAREFFAARTPQLSLATMQDGGIPTAGALQQCNEAVWREFNEAFATLHRYEQQ